MLGNAILSLEYFFITFCVRKVILYKAGNPALSGNTEILLKEIMPEEY